MDDDNAIDITIDARRFAGVFANGVRLDAQADEFTIDFLRLDPHLARAMVVARVTCTPHFARSLIDRLETLWHTWAETAMPPEVGGNELP